MPLHNVVYLPLSVSSLQLDLRNTTARIVYTHVVTGIKVKSAKKHPFYYHQLFETATSNISVFLVVPP